MIVISCPFDLKVPQSRGIKKDHEMNRVEGVTRWALNPPLLPGWTRCSENNINRHDHLIHSSVHFVCDINSSLSLFRSLPLVIMKAPLFLALLLIFVMMSDEAHGHTPLSMMRTMGRWATRPFRSMASGMRSIRPLKHLIVKGLMAKKLALVKAGLIAKPLVAKAILLKKVLHKGRSLLPGAASRSPAVPAVRAEPMVTVPTPQRYIILQPSVRQIPRQVMMAHRETPTKKM